MSKKIIIVNGVELNELLLDAGTKYMSARTLYTGLLLNMKHRGVQFGDLETFLLQYYKEQGFWTLESDLEKADALDLAWYHKLYLFLSWVKNNYESYDKKKRKKAVRPSTIKREKAEKKGKRRKPVNEEQFLRRLNVVEKQPELLASLVAFLEEKGYEVKKKDNEE